MENIELIKHLIKENSYKVEYKHTVGYEMSEVELSDVAELIVKKLTITDVSTRLSQMITDLDNKIINTTYDDGEHLAWDKDDIRCMQRTLQLLND